MVNKATKVLHQREQKANKAIKVKKGRRAKKATPDLREHKVKRVTKV
jgi:hypothetical protein